MTLSERIVKILESQAEWLSSAEIDQLAGANHPTYTTFLLKKLVTEKKVERKREGRKVLYRQSLVRIFLDEELNLAFTDENEVFAAVRKNPDFQTRVTEQVRTIAEFAFTEMLNNAKDHSGSIRGAVKVWEEDGRLKFVVRDYGVGVFRHIIRARGLADEMEAMQELAKGKLTTRPRKHSGEGIFWTSKMADKFRLASYDYAWMVDNAADDYAAEKLETEVGGTEVFFEIAVDAEKSASEIFSEYSLDKETYSFDTTEIPLKLYNGGDFWVSRSQAKRVLVGLEKYKKVIIDFKGIDLVGQGFADEVFRVFRLEHPGIWLEPINMTESVRMMVMRALNDRTGE